MSILIILTFIGQDPTFTNHLSRKYIKETLNLDKPGGSLQNYNEKGICRSLGIDLNNVYATNIFKYFYTIPPARIPDFMYSHLDLIFKLLRHEVLAFHDVSVKNLGEPVLQMLSTGNCFW